VRIPLKLIKSVWVRFCKQSAPERQAAINEFVRTQPYVHELVLSQDQEWYPNKPPTIRLHALFIWLVFLTAHRGKIPAVTRAHIADLLLKGINQMDTIAEESEFRANEIVNNDMRTHPQFDLFMFVAGYFTRKEDNPELTDTSIKATVSHLNTVIRAFDVAVNESNQ